MSERQRANVFGPDRRLAGRLAHRGRCAGDRRRTAAAVGTQRRMREAMQ
jgi:hypothetical protein